MLFIAGVTQGTKEILYQAAAFVCGRCGRYGRYQVYMTYMCLSLFFIPILKWNKKYYARKTCCQTVYELAPEVGRRLEKGEAIEIRPQDLTPVSGTGGGWGTGRKRCANCGYETDEDFDFCPKCGHRF